MASFYGWKHIPFDKLNCRRIERLRFVPLEYEIDHQTRAILLTVDHRARDAQLREGVRRHVSVNIIFFMAIYLLTRNVNFWHNPRSVMCLEEAS